jgi:small-conductance mechanosensitive channel
MPWEENLLLMQHIWQLMSEERESVNDNTNQSSKEEAPGVSEYESETVLPVTEEEGEGREDTATEEPLEEESERSAIEQPSQPQLEVQAKPKRQKQRAKTVNTIQKTWADTSNLLVKQTTQISKINQNLQSLQKQMKACERQGGIVNQLRSQINMIQRQITQVHKIVQKRPASKIQSGKKVSRNKKKNKK